MCLCTCSEVIGCTGESCAHLRVRRDRGAVGFTTVEVRDLTAGGVAFTLVVVSVLTSHYHIVSDRARTFQPSYQRCVIGAQDGGAHTLWHTRDWVQKKTNIFHVILEILFLVVYQQTIREFHMLSVTLITFFTCLKGLADADATVARGSLSRDTYIEIQTTWKFSEHTGGGCCMAAVLIAFSYHLSKKADTSRRFGPTSHCCVGSACVLFGYESWRTGS